MFHVRKSILADVTTNQNKDVHQGTWDGFVQVKKGEAKETLKGIEDGVRKQSVPDVIVIEDDGSSEVENYDSEAVTRRSQSHYHSSSSGYSLDESSFDTSKLADSSDEDDCVVIEPHATAPPSFLDIRFSKSRKRPRPHADDILFESGKKRSSPSDLSDCEIVVDSDGKVRQDWEEAALRRRTGKAMYRAESEESTSFSNHANSNPRRSPKGKQSQDMQTHATDQQLGPEFSAPGVGPDVGKEKREDAGFNLQDSNLDVSDVGSDDSNNEEASSAGNILKRSGNDASDNVKPVELGLSDGLSHFDDAEASRRMSDTPISEEKDVTLPSADNLFTDRELLKRTEEFRHADEEEWSRRHQELQKQAEEAQRERRRRKIEAERRREMEARQRRRLDEIRQSQLKEEQTSGFKEQVRDRIQSELERVAATCRDMATLLRQLGVSVEGGPFATTQQVTAAYKKALFRFHPDRAAALAKSDPAHQVEAEEKFKLVSRMKGVLPLVSSSYFR